MEKQAPYGFKYVPETAEEVAAYVELHHGRRPPVYRVECLECGKRLWGSGLGVGSHRRAHLRAHPARGEDA